MPTSLAHSQAAQSNYYQRPPDERFPTLDALIAHARNVREHCAERVYSLRDLHAEPNGRGVDLHSLRGAAPLTHWSFGQLTRTVGAPAGYLRSLPAPLAADCINHGISQTPDGTRANVLIRVANGTDPIVRACTSDTYGRVWDEVLYSGFRDTVARHTNAYGHDWIAPPTWTGEPAGFYAGDRDSFVIMIDGGSIVPDPSGERAAPLVVAGPAPFAGLASPGPGSTSPAGQDARTLYRGILMRNSEVGAAGIIIESILFRAICGNHLLMGAVLDSQFRRRHVGDASNATIQEIGRIALKWTQRSAAADAALIQSLISHEIAVSKDAVISELRALGATAEQATHAYETAERTEAISPRSYWGIAQGITRDAQTETDGYQNDRYDLDRLAAQVLARGAKLVRA